MAQEYRTWRARLDEVHDGDTVRLVVDCGFDQTVRKWFRLRRVFAPELKQSGGAACRDAVVEWMRTATMDGGDWPLEIDTYRTTGGNDLKTLDRYVAEVRDCKGESLNEGMLTVLATRPDWPRGTGA